ncbi:MAG: ATP-binding cassette domain-containing protein, partial [Clostridiales bacterium]|nr:ATP-binding cassette domain-containing protein [Clostridiales bacterium]
MQLELKEINKSFGEKHVLKGVSFIAESGKAFGLLGRNGAGKTTAIRILMDVFPADSGQILVDGKPINYKEVEFGYLPEERGLYPKKVIVDQLAYFAELKGMSRKEAIKSVDYWLERLGMSEYRGKRLDTLSKGNQ